MTASQAVDLRSDAVTLPSAAMRDAMSTALVGDDDFGEDPTINRLEQRAAELLGKDAALFVLSGTMGNLVALLSQTQRGQSAVAGEHSHIYDHEYRGITPLCGLTFRPVPETVQEGRLLWDMALLSALLDEPVQSRPGIVCLEQTINRLGGVVMPLDHMAEICSLSQSRGIPVHLDGARLPNAAVALGVSMSRVARDVDTVMMVFTKCLGAPAGAVLAGSREAIERARLQRHYVGGGLKQGGVLAATCLVALEQADTIVGDHRRSQRLASELARLGGLGVAVENVVSNIVLVDVRPLGIGHQEMLDALREAGVLASRALPGILRLVVHRDLGDEDIDLAVAAFERVVERIGIGTRGLP